MKSEDINSLYIDVLQNLKDDGIINAKRRELAFVTLTLEDMDKNMLFFPFAQRNWPWILRECSDRIYNVTNPGISYKFSKNWENRIEDSGLYSYDYADRLNDQMNKLLSKNKQGRDKIIQVWRDGDWEMKGRQPCTIIMQPILEADNKMSLIVYMRNNDMINIFPSDVFIHSTYFKYWCIKNNIEYKNLYWVSSVAYYQKKRDTLDFPNRLISQWKDFYVNATKWDKDIVCDMDIKEVYERQAIYNIDRQESIEKCLGELKTDYVKEWFKLILLKLYKIEKNKKEYMRIKDEKWNTEFSIIKDGIKA